MCTGRLLEEKKSAELISLDLIHSFLFSVLTRLRTWSRCACVRLYPKTAEDFVYQMKKAMPDFEPVAAKQSKTS